MPVWIDERTNSSVVGCITKGPHQFVLTSLQASQRPNGQKKAVSWSSPVVQHVQLTVIDFSRRPFRDRVITHSRCPLQRCWVPTRREKVLKNWLNPWLITYILEKKGVSLLMESFYHNFDGICLWFLTMERFHQKSNANNWVKTKQSVSFHSKSQLKKHIISSKKL